MASAFAAAFASRLPTVPYTSRKPELYASTIGPVKPGFFVSRFLGRVPSAIHLSVLPSSATCAASVILWFFGRRKAPQYGRWTYWEKFDYYAVFWGVAIIGSSGSTVRLLSDG